MGIKLGPTLHKGDAESHANPIIFDVDYFLDGVASSSSGTTLYETMAAQIGRKNQHKVSILPLGTTASVPADDVIVTGEVWNDVTKVFEDGSETISLLANQSTIEEGVKTFRRVDSVLFPVQDGAGATYDVGIVADMQMYIPVRKAFFLMEATLLTPGVPTTASDDFILTRDSVHGASYDVNIIDQDMDALAIKSVLYSSPYVLVEGDVLKVTYANLENDTTGGILITGITG